MPVLGLCVEHRIGSYVKPSAVIKATSPVDRILGSSNSRLTRRRKFLTIPGTAPTHKKEANVVIAAYGTQITLHNAAMSVTNCRMNKSSSGTCLQSGRSTPSQIAVPTACQEDDCTASNFIDVRITTRLAASGENVKNTGNSSFPPPSTFSSEVYNDERSKMSQLAPVKENDDQVKKKFAWRRTAWDKPTSNIESSASITSFVDFKEIENSVSDATYSANHQQTAKRIVKTSPETENVQRPSSASGPIVRTVYPQPHDNSFESILRYYLAPRLNGTGLQHQVSNNKIKEVWGARSKNDVSARMQFTHEKLLRPKSASLPLTNRLNHENTSAIYDENVNDNLHSNLAKGTGPHTKKTRRRRPRSVTYNKSNKARTSPITLSQDANAGLSTISLIRQSHRPTTAIIYSKPDAKAMPSITPCVRKARVWHKTFACKHQRSCDSASERAQSIKTSDDSKGHLSLNTAVKVSKLSQPFTGKADTAPAKATTEETTVAAASEVSNSSIPSQSISPEAPPQIQTDHCGLVTSSVGEDEADCKQYKVSDSPQIVDNATFSQDGLRSECSSIVTEIDQNCPEKGDHNYVPQTHKNLCAMTTPGVKIRPLFTQHVAKFNGPSANDVMETGKKNKMIRQWLKSLNSSKAKSGNGF